jgi:hypothetical protein
MSKANGGLPGLERPRAAGWLLGFTCGDCPLWRDLSGARARGARVPKRAGQLVRPGECRLRPAPVFHPQFGLETFPLLDAEEPGCAGSPLAAATPRKAGKSSPRPDDRAGT